ncbi:MAG: hypothetical protein WCO35_02370 [Candidatus Nomurabacteria bacterium]
MEENKIKDDVKNKAIDFINNYILNNYSGEDNKLKASLGVLQHKDNLDIIEADKELRKSNEKSANAMKCLTFALVMVGVISIGVQIWATYHNSSISCPTVGIIK